MKLKYVTCSGINEHTDPQDLFELYREFPQIEFGIQVSGRKCFEDSPRMKFLQHLQSEIKKRNINLPLALHLNQDFVEEFCAGNISNPALMHLFKMTSSGSVPMFQRLQLNFKIGREKIPDMIMLESIIEYHRHHNRRFILSYSDSNASYINNLHARRRCTFDCLYDNSFGEGVLSSSRPAPAFPDVLQGYAGGLSPENVASELAKINLLVPPQAEIFVDAEGRLKDDSGHVSVERCHLFVANALKWEQENC